MKKDLSSQPLLKRLGKHTLNFGLGNVLPKLIGFVLIPVYAIHLSPEDFGIIDLTMSLAAFLIIGMRLGLTGSVLRFFFDYDGKEDLQNFITTMFWVLIFAGISIGVLMAIIADPFLERLIPNLPVYPFIYMAILIAAFKANSDLQRRLIQAREQSAYAAKLNTIIALLTIGLTLLFVVVCKMDAFGVILAFLISAAIFFLQAQYYLRNDLKGSFQFKMLPAPIKYGAGILPYHLLNEAAPLINKSILSGYGSLAAVGIFGIAYRFASPLNIIISAFNSAYLPVYFKMRKEGDQTQYDQLRRSMRFIWVGAVVLFLLVSLVGPPLIELLTPLQYHEGAALLPYFGIIFLLQVIGVLFGIEIFYSQKTYWNTIISIASIFSNIAIVFATVQAFGIYSLVFGLLASSIITCSMRTLIAQKMFKFPMELKFFTISILPALATFILVAYLKSYFDLEALISVVIGLSGVLVYIGYLILKNISAKIF